jgi:hypothetical protein
MRAGEALTQLVEFTDGAPDGDIAWQLLDGTGAKRAEGSVTPEAGSASAVIGVSGDYNDIEPDVLASPRELQWSYTVAGVIRRGRLRYRLEIYLPFGISEDGVRRKLGLETHELEDESIDLVDAYSRFRETVGVDALAATAGDAALRAGHAIEAMCAIGLIPSLQIKLAAKQSSGTDQFQRSRIDWEMVRAELEAFVTDGIAAVSETTATFGSLLIPVIRDDPVTGS